MKISEFLIGLIDKLIFINLVSGRSTSGYLEDFDHELILLRRTGHREFVFKHNVVSIIIDDKGAKE